MLNAALESPVNPNPLAFEELATALASLASFNKSGSMADPIDEYQHLYKRALQHPLGYREITELTGNGLDASDRRAGKAAWLLLNIAGLEVVSVHSVVWHKVDDRFSAPLLDQLSRALGVESSIGQKRLQALGGKPSVLDVAGVKDGAIYLVQTIWCKELTDSAFKEPGTVNKGLWPDTSIVSPSTRPRGLAIH